MDHPVRDSLIMGAVYALGGLLTAALVSQGPPNADTVVFFTATGCGAFVSGGTLWWKLVARRAHAGYLRGALTGVGAALAAHALTSALLTVWSGMGDTAFTAQDTVFGGLLFAAMTVVVIGWFTMPLSALLGVGAIAVRRRWL